MQKRRTSRAGSLLRTGIPLPAQGLPLGVDDANQKQISRVSTPDLPDPKLRLFHDAGELHF
jgi:hypothetical protein